MCRVRFLALLGAVLRSEARARSKMVSPRLRRVSCFRGASAIRVCSSFCGSGRAEARRVVLGRCRVVATSLCEFVPARRGMFRKAWLCLAIGSDDPQLVPQGLRGCPGASSDRLRSFFRGSSGAGAKHVVLGRRLHRGGLLRFDRRPRGHPRLLVRRLQLHVVLPRDAADGGEHRAGLRSVAPLGICVGSSRPQLPQLLML